MSIDAIAKISAALLTPVIGCITTYIAVQQYKINKRKLAMDSYDRRLRIYEEVRKILSIIMRDGTASGEDLLKFKQSVSEADFLFGPEIMSYIDEIHKHGINLHTWNQKYRNFTQTEPEGYDHKKVCEGMDNELRWLIDQFEPAKQKFKKYLNIRY
jgi:hypothetical protein